MATCKGCGNRISSHAITCMECGLPVDDTEEAGWSVDDNFDPDESYYEESAGDLSFDSDLSDLSEISFDSWGSDFDDDSYH